MNSLKNIKTAFLAQLCDQFNLEKSDLSAVTFELNVQEEKQPFGDISSNAALVQQYLLDWFVIVCLKQVPHLN